MLADAANQLGAALIAMTAEEVAELLAKLGGADKAAAVAQIKTYNRIAKAGRALSAANESEIRAACELMETAGGKLGGVLGDVTEDDDGADDGDDKSIDADYFTFRARAAEIRAAV
jgi:hypothetical protein